MRTTDATVGTRIQRDARERILTTAYDLFAQHGIRAVGVDKIIAESGVAKATFYRHFPSKDELVLAFLQRHEQRWTRNVLEAGARSAGDTPRERLLALFDVLHEWLTRRENFAACSFIATLLEMGAGHPVGRASIGYLAAVREIMCAWAEEAQLHDPIGFAHTCHLLMKGAIIAAVEGDTGAAHRAQTMARILIDHHAPRQR